MLVMLMISQGVRHVQLLQLLSYCTSPLTCSDFFCDNLLLEAENFYHFKSYIQQRCDFFNLLEFLVMLELHKKSHCGGSIVIYDDFWIKIVFKTNQIMYYGHEFGKHLAHPLFIFNVMFMLGYSNLFKFVQRQILCQLLLKKLSQSLYLLHYQSTLDDHKIELLLKFHVLF